MASKAWGSPQGLSPSIWKHAPENPGVSQKHQKGPNKNHAHEPYCLKHWQSFEYHLSLQSITAIQSTAKIQARSPIAQITGCKLCGHKTVASCHAQLQHKHGGGTLIIEILKKEKGARSTIRHPQEKLKPLCSESSQVHYLKTQIPRKRDPTLPTGVQRMQPSQVIMEGYNQGRVSPSGVSKVLLSRFEPHLLCLWAPSGVA